ncbi:uncharacterized protein LOC116343167 isoform X2 [Contarinia nasturtii]|uniref:uncharacterized protein LOC116343167 isoform X2 n=1 Tax=Contarinia nasturtii TaxID=265458 RepID=UPI0012D39CBA|nr:uncharacterized protein LOC116343167 isoform X2 [Contarinia nasturtii]
MLKYNFFILIFFGIFIPNIIKAMPKNNEDRCNLIKALYNLKKEEKALMVFQGKDKKKNDLVNYYIKYVPEISYNEAVDFMEKNYLRDAPTFGSLNATDVVQFRESWLDELNYGMSVACFKEGSKEIIGLSILIKYPWDQSPQLTNGFNVFEHYGVSEYLRGSGMVVSSDYRGRGIGKKLVECREIVCKDHGLTITSSLFTTKYSNKIANDCGFETNIVRGYSDSGMENLSILKSKRYNFASSSNSQNNRRNIMCF